MARWLLVCALLLHATDVVPASAIGAAKAHDQRLVDGSMTLLVDQQPRIVVIVGDERERDDHYEGQRLKSGHDAGMRWMSDSF